ncbi:concanavalin A-like lectin/glucanase domain-containing protein [Glomus cerebriforme]|uniref:Concanavalin A-like lectin/glucanase domain-containing protein n=1 Tax=Glomus cerebriforme TaxID=658196 RepID=A0A397T471_9GLOM|nr:concanavalin A-like lectin/glucanase domain-containing protein [Glomus cerebriforme]
MAPMETTRGYSLANDLKFLINNKNYSDIKIICQDELIIYGNRAILAARSSVLDRLLFNGMKESSINEIKFPEIKFHAMEIILEYLYTENFESESLSLEISIEAYHAADYFQLEQLQQKIVNFVKQSLKERHQCDTKENGEILAPKLLSKAVEKMSPLADNDMIKLLIEWISKTSLEVIGFDSLSFQALQCLLSQTYSSQGPFVTPEYTVFRYAVIQAANNISENAISIIEKKLPVWNDLNKMCEEYSENDSDSQYEEIRSELKEMLSTILPFIDLRRIDTNILVDRIEPLQLLSTSLLLNAYRFQAKEKKSLPHMRGIPLFEWNLQWDKNSKGSNLFLKECNTVVESNPGGLNTTHQNVRANNLIYGEGIYEWEVVIEETCIYAWVGVCTERGLDYNIFAGQQSCAWVLGSSGKCYHNNIGLHYVTEFGSGTKITVHLNMTERSIAFSINGVMHPPVSNWSNLPSKLYPIVSLNSPGRIRLSCVRDWNHIYYKNQKNLKLY